MRRADLLVAAFGFIVGMFIISYFVFLPSVMQNFYQLARSMFGPDCPIDPFESLIIKIPGGIAIAVMSLLFLRGTTRAFLIGFGIGLLFDGLRMYVGWAAGICPA